jgi:hypothetical protein
MLVTNQHIDKLSASQVDFTSWGLLSNMPPFGPNLKPLYGDSDAIQVPGPRVLNVVTLAITRGLDIYFLSPSTQLTMYIHSN